MQGKIISRLFEYEIFIFLKKIHNLNLSKEFYEMLKMW